MAKGRSILDILAGIKPSRKTAHVQMLWPEITAMSAAMLTYPEMARVLGEHYGLQISARRLGIIVRKIRQNPPSILDLDEQRDHPTAVKAEDGPLAEAQRRHKEKSRSIFAKGGD